MSIEPKPVNVSGTRLYDGTVNAAASDLSVSSGTVGSETLNISGTGTLLAGGAGSRTITDTSGLSLQMEPTEELVQITLLQVGHII